MSIVAAFGSAVDSGGNPSVGAFGNLRVVNPETIFDSKLLGDEHADIWSDEAVSGAGTTSVYSSARASVRIGVTNLTAGVRARQSRIAVNYQSGKSQRVIMTAIPGAAATGVTRRWGLFNENDGLFFEQTPTALRVVRRSSVSGAPVDTVVEQADWNIDVMDGTGVSGVTLDLSTANIFTIDFAWLGVGAVRFGVVVDGVVRYVHSMQNGNTLTSVYMSTPNLPVRYEIRNDGTGPTATLECICATVVSEGGVHLFGDFRHASTGSSTVNANSAGTLYAILGLRQKTTHPGTSIRQLTASLLATGANDNYEWVLLRNPTVAGGGLSYADVTESGIERGLPDTAGNPSTTTVTGGTPIGGGYGTARTQINTPVAQDWVSMGRTVGGVRDEIVLAVRPLTSNIDVAGGLDWREAL